ncbi:MAG: hypothetical protein A2017_13735 [Lentisphaerae bacterium GWF2_44_16]|nr:MAG: hypothetical protein A2017_13735 [Lentisphaerae bacterium GWF2_44_16]
MNKEEIKKILKKSGLKKGDIVLLHSSYAAIGKVDGGGDSVIDAFLETLGKDGTLAVPVFGSLGILTELVSKRPGAIKSVHPKAGVAAIGKDAEKICAKHWEADIAHAENTPYTRIADMGGYICLMGVDQDRNTTLHTVEELLRLPYLEESSVAAFETPEGKTVSKSWKFFPGPHRDFVQLDGILRESGKMKTFMIGNAVTRLIKGREMIDIMLETGRKNPAFALCSNPNCADCVKQRANLNRSILSEESFKLSVSAALAGRYVPEIVENMKAAGVDAVELDYLNGMPFNLLKKDFIARAVMEFKENKISVSSFRFQAIPENFSEMLDLALDNSVDRIIIPLAGNFESAIAEAEEKGISVSLFNTNISSITVSEALLKLKEKGLKPKFTFNAANFALSGEKPFLKSYKQKLKRFIDQLDIEDALFSGIFETPANGSAEIKEMISILRCASYSGFMTLGAKNRIVSNLNDTVSSFISLLKTM